MKNLIRITFCITFWIIFGTKVNGQEMLTNLITQKRTVSSYNQITVGSAMQVTIQEGNLNEIEITCQNYVLPYVESKTKNGELTLKLSKPIRRKGTLAVLVTIHVKTLNQIKLDETASVSSKVSILTKKINMKLNKSSTVSLKIVAETLQVKLYDSSSASIMGMVKSALLHLTDSSVFTADSLSISSLNILLNGASQASVFVTDTLSATADDVSVLTYRGIPSVISRKVNGQATINNLAK